MKKMKKLHRLTRKEISKSIVLFIGKEKQGRKSIEGEKKKIVIN
jgi:hypothetical protein